MNKIENEISQYLWISQQEIQRADWLSHLDIPFKEPIRKITVGHVIRTPVEGLG